MIQPKLTEEEQAIVTAMGSGQACPRVDISWGTGMPLDRFGWILGVGCRYWQRRGVALWG